MRAYISNMYSHLSHILCEQVKLFFGDPSSLCTFKQQLGGRMSCMEISFYVFLFFSFLFSFQKIASMLSVNKFLDQSKVWSFKFIWFPPLINCNFCNWKQIHLLFNHASPMGPDFSFSFLISQKNTIFMIAGKVWSLILNSFPLFSHNVVDIIFKILKDC